SAVVAQVRINLRKADGTAQGGYDADLPPDGALSARVESLFPGLPPGFIGYATIAATQPVIVSGTLSSAFSSASVAAQPLTDANLAPTARYAVRLGESNTGATLRLVNFGTSAANVTVSARTLAGVQSETTPLIQLPPGAQYSRPINE